MDEIVKKKSSSKNARSVATRRIGKGKSRDFSAKSTIGVHAVIYRILSLFPSRKLRLKTAARAGRMDNANYLWIQRFYSALNDKVRAGFVMAKPIFSNIATSPCAIPQFLQ